MRPKRDSHPTISPPVTGWSRWIQNEGFRKADCRVRVFNADARCAANSHHDSTQLAVLAAPAVIARKDLAFSVTLRLAGETKPNSRQGGASGRWDLLTTFLALGKAFTLRQTTAGTGNFIRDRIVDLFLYGTITCPTSGHSQASFQPFIHEYDDITVGKKSSRVKDRSFSFTPGSHPAEVRREFPESGSRRWVPTNGVSPP